MAAKWTAPSIRLHSSVARCETLRGREGGPDPSSIHRGPRICRRSLNRVALGRTTCVGRELSTDYEVRSRITGKVGARVLFKYPGNEGHKRGTLIARIVTQGGKAKSGVRYWNVVDLVEFPSERQKRWIRFGYYRQDGNRLRWAGQTSLAEPYENMRRLFKAASTRAPWFRKLVSGLDSPPRTRLRRTGSG